jgi:hypothetical protein
LSYAPGWRLQNAPTGWQGPDRELYPAIPGEVLSEPPLGLLLDLIERARLFEEMTGALDDDQLLWRYQPIIGGAIELDDLGVEAAEDEQGRRQHMGERVPRAAWRRPIVARAEPSAAAAMRKDHQAGGVAGHSEQTLQPLRPNVDFDRMGTVVMPMDSKIRALPRPELYVGEPGRQRLVP